MLKEALPLIQRLVLYFFIPGLLYAFTVKHQQCQRHALLKEGCVNSLFPFLFKQSLPNLYMPNVLTQRQSQLGVLNQPSADEKKWIESGGFLFIWPRLF